MPIAHLLLAPLGEVKAGFLLRLPGKTMYDGGAKSVQIRLAYILGLPK